jgi:lysozyme
MDETLEQRIMRQEGFTPVAKIDVSPDYVIGYGHDITPDELPQYSNGITQQSALVLLSQDIQNAKTEANNSFPWILGLDDVRQDVIYDMVFQMGAAGVKDFPKMIAAIRDKDYNTASKEMLNSQWHSETPDRCEELANLMLYGDEQPT